MFPPPAAPLTPEPFHGTWSLWSQAPILLGVVLLTLRPLLRAVRGVSWSRPALVLAVAAPLVVAWLLPQERYVFSGHEEIYGELLDGATPEPGSLSSMQTFPLPAGVAWALGRVAPGEPATVAWLLLNRCSLALLLLALAAAAAWTVRRQSGEEEPDGRRERGAALAAVVGGLAAAHLAGWSATGFFLAPAFAFGAVALALGLAREPEAAIAWGGLAVATRLEAAPLLLAAVIAAGWPRLRRPATWGALLVLGWELTALGTKGSAAPLVEARLDLMAVLENLSLTPLGGAWVGWPALALVAALAALARWPDRRSRVALAVGLLAALLQPLPLVDVGARHLQSAVVLVIVLSAAALVAPGVAGGRARLARTACVALLLAWVAARAGAEWRGLEQRYMASADAWLPAWVEAADAGLRGPVSELLDDSCYTVVPRGKATWRGSRDTRDAAEVRRASQARRAGWCVQWLVETGAEFSGDTRAEKLDRAIRTLDLEPVGWVDPPPEGSRPWLLFEVRPEE